MAKITTDAEKKWLLTTHLHGHKVIPFEYAVLVGPEESPRRIVLYPGGGAPPVSYVQCDDCYRIDRRRAGPMRSGEL